MNEPYGFAFRDVAGVILAQYKLHVHPRRRQVTQQTIDRLDKRLLRIAKARGYITTWDHAVTELKYDNTFFLWREVARMN